MKVGPVDLDQEVLIIAEVGNNHEGSFALAEELIGRAAEAGAGAVKFQTIVPDKLHTVLEEKRINQLRRFQLSYDQFRKLSRTAERCGILFLSTPFDLESARELDEILPAFKIASGDNSFFPLLEVTARTGKPLLVSCGMSELSEIERSVEVIRCAAKNELSEQLVLLHCVSAYPTSPAEANLSAITTLKRFGTTVGYSDHTLGISAAVLAVALGARVIEKHFTLDKQHSDFRDHQLSAEPVELAELCERVREAQLLLGNGTKTVQQGEAATRTAARRSIVAARELRAGAQLSEADLSWVRPGGGLAPGAETQLIGKRLRLSRRSGEMILPEHVE